MKYHPEKHHRRTIRLRGYDYAKAGAYFITIVTQNREHIFGEIANGELMMNENGEIAKQYWLEIPLHFPNVSLDKFLIMPNHIHGIIIINDNIIGAKYFSPWPAKYYPENCFYFQYAVYLHNNRNKTK